MKKKIERTQITNTKNDRHHYRLNRNKKNEFHHNGTGTECRGDKRGLAELPWAEAEGLQEYYCGQRFPQEEWSRTIRSPGTGTAWYKGSRGASPGAGAAAGVLGEGQAAL